jgi:colanic acid biosynthesis glycosyl transferase WcaI
VGMIHPCKIYNVLALGLRHLSLGPAECHLRDLSARVSDKRYSMACDNSDVTGLADLLRGAAAVGELSPSAELQTLAAEFSQRRLMPQLVDLLEAVGGRN